MRMMILGTCYNSNDNNKCENNIGNKEAHNKNE